MSASVQDQLAFLQAQVTALQGRCDAYDAAILIAADKALAAALLLEENLLVLANHLFILENGNQEITSFISAVVSQYQQVVSDYISSHPWLPK